MPITCGARHRVRLVAVTVFLGSVIGSSVAAFRDGAWLAGAITLSGSVFLAVKFLQHASIQAGERSSAGPALRVVMPQWRRSPLSEPRPADGPDPPLSDRERQVLALLIRGLTNREIALTLIISPHTAKAHIANILSKLAVRDRTQAAVRAIELGYVTPLAVEPSARRDGTHAQRMLR
jgi:DNA-binding NarL/FixJ family response regulator